MSEQVRDYADKIIRDALLKPENLRALVAARVPDLVNGFDFTRVRLVSPKFLLPDGRDREADLLFEIPYRVGDEEKIALVCVLIEHQTRADSRMALRTLLYLVLYWEKQWSAWESLPTPKPAFRLPPVLPIVFHTGTQPWGGARSIKDLLGDPKAFHQFAPDWTPLFWELPKHSVEELLSSDVAFLQLLAVVRVEDADREEFERVFREIWRKLEPLHETNRVRWADLIYFLIGWMIHRRPATEEKQLLEMAKGLASDSERNTEGKDMVQTIADVLLAEGERKGEMKWRVDEARQTILRSGGKKLGPIDSKSAELLNAIGDIDRLRSIADRAPEVASWAELLESK